MGLRFVSGIGAMITVMATVAFAVPTSKAATILTFSQSGVASTVSATTNPGGTATSISVVNALVTISSIAAGATTPFNAFLNLTAGSTSAASLVGASFILQSFSGTFSFTSAAGGSGTNYLSGSFSDRLSGSGSGLTLSASTPTDTVSFTSDLIPAAALLPPDAVSLAFTDVSPPASIDNQTLAAFTSNISGNFSAAAPIVASEPASIAVLGMALIGLGCMRRQRG